MKLSYLIVAFPLVSAQTRGLQTDPSDVPSLAPSGSFLPSLEPSGSSLPSSLPATGTGSSTSKCTTWFEDAFNDLRPTEKGFSNDLRPTEKADYVRLKLDLPARCPGRGFDPDSDGSNEPWASPTVTDSKGNMVQVVCLPALAEYHVLVNGESAGKCPWPGGRNSAWLYGLDADGDGSIDMTNDGKIVEIKKVIWISADGPLPGEWGIVTDAIYNVRFDFDRDGKIDINAYQYCLEDETGTLLHYKVDLDGTNRAQASDPETFTPGDPSETPSDNALTPRLRFSQGANTSGSGGYTAMSAFVSDETEALIYARCPV